MSEKEILKTLQIEWSLRFDQGNWEGLASLYSNDAQLFGGKPELYVGIKGITSYFYTVPPHGQAVFQDEFTIKQLAEDVILTSGYVEFRRHGSGRMFRLTWVMRNEKPEWKIIAHHASPLQ